MLFLTLSYAMDEWLEEYMIHLESDDQPQEDPVATALEAVRGQLAGLQLQQENICEYLEKGIYILKLYIPVVATGQEGISPKEEVLICTQ